jgi:putative transposase
MKTFITSDNYYHVFNRGVSKQTLFYDNVDYARFLFLLLYLQSPISFPQVGRNVGSFLKKKDFRIQEKTKDEIIEKRFVEIINFCIMPNHFHITVKALSDDGVSKYMQKVSNAYAKYFNTRYHKSGHVFQGSYKARLVTTDKQFMYLSAYIHRNPNELINWKGESLSYPWSSYQDYTHNRWGRLLNHEPITGTFNSPEDYREYVETSGAKEDWEDDDIYKI